MQYYAIKNLDTGEYYSDLAADFYEIDPMSMYDRLDEVKKKLSRLKDYYPNLKIEVFNVISAGFVEEE